jgi:hypothetical protein
MTRPRTVIRPIFLFEHGPFGKPVPTFPGHALEAFHIAAVRLSAQTAFGRIGHSTGAMDAPRTASLFAPAHKKAPDDAGALI